MEWSGGSDGGGSAPNDVPLGIQAMMMGVDPADSASFGAGGRVPLGDFQAAMSSGETPIGPAASGGAAAAMMMQQGAVRNQQAMMAQAKMFSQAASMVQAAGMAKMLKQIAEWEWAEENDGKRQAEKKKQAAEEQAPAGFDPEALQKAIAAAKEREEEEKREAEEAAVRREFEEKAEKIAKAKLEIERAEYAKRKRAEEDELLRLRRRAEEAEARLARLEASKGASGAPGLALATLGGPPGRSSGSKVMRTDDIQERVHALAEGFELEQEAAEGLMRVFLDRALMGCDIEVDLAMFSEHLATSNKPSELVNFMLDDLRQGSTIHPCTYYKSRVESGSLRPGDSIAMRFHEGLPSASRDDPLPTRLDESGPLSSDWAFRASQDDSVRPWSDAPPLEKSGDNRTDDAMSTLRRTADEVAARIAATVAHDRKSKEIAHAVGADKAMPQKPKPPEPAPDAFLSKQPLRPRSPSRPRESKDREYDRRDRNYDNRDRRDGFYDRRQRSRSRGRSRSRYRSRSRGRRSRSKSADKRGLPKESSIPLAPAEGAGVAGDRSPPRPRRNRQSKWDSTDAPPQPAYKPSAMPKALPMMSNHYKVLRMQAIQIRNLLGRGGETINDIRRRTGADIKVHHPPHEPEGTVSIVGNAGMAEQLIAQALIMKGCPLPTAEPLEQDIDDIPIPAHLVGLFIGTAGAQIKELQRMVGDAVGISVQPPEVPGGLQAIRIVGQNREHAKQLIQLKVDAIMKGHLGTLPLNQMKGGGNIGTMTPNIGGKGQSGIASSTSNIGAISL